MLTSSVTTYSNATRSRCWMPRERISRGRGLGLATVAGGKPINSGHARGGRTRVSVSIEFAGIGSLIWRGFVNVKSNIEEFRGIRKLPLNLGERNFCICGLNGSGKSGIVDAIEFALTGDISTPALRCFRFCGGLRESRDFGACSQHIHPARV